MSALWFRLRFPHAPVKRSRSTEPLPIPRSTQRGLRPLTRSSMSSFAWLVSITVLTCTWL
jgi:hypothetical protein